MAQVELKGQHVPCPALDVMVILVMTPTARDLSSSCVFQLNLSIFTIFGGIP